MKRTLILSFITSIFVPGMIFAQPDIYTIITNPGEDAAAEMRISWHTDMGVEDCFVEYTKKTDVDWENAIKIMGDYTVSTTWDGIDTRIGATRFTQDIKLHKYGAVLSGLDPDTDYMYRIGRNDLSGETRYFKTAGATEFSFAWISDYHAYEPLPGRLTSAMNMISRLISVDQNVDFILSTGDDVAYGGSHSYWKDVFASSHYKNYMWVTMNGNHDNMDISDTKNTPAFFRDTHNNPQNGYAGQEGVSYWFRYGNVLWIVLNTEDLNNASQIPKAQEWVAEVIRRNPSQYIFVAQHYQWFSGASGSYGGAGFTRWNAFFDKWGVDLALAGNNHIYVRTHPLYDEQVSTEPGKGTVYLQAPSSDNDRGNPMNPTLSSNAEKIAYRWTEGASTIGGSLITVNEEEIKVSLYDRNSTRLDYAEIPANRPAIHLMPPIINYVAPEELSNVNPGTPIELTFSRKMDKTSVEEAISLMPQATVAYTWLNDYVVSVDISKLEYSTDYELTIDATKAKDSQTNLFIDGNSDGVAGDDYSLAFTTMLFDAQAPEIILTDPDNEGVARQVRSVIRIEYDEVITAESVLPDQITLTPAVNGVVQRGVAGDRSALHFIPAEDLADYTTYTVNIAAGLKDQFGNTTTGKSFTFSTDLEKLDEVKLLDNFDALVGWWTLDGAGQTVGLLPASGVSISSTYASDSNMGKSAKIIYNWDTTHDAPYIRWYLPPANANVEAKQFNEKYVLRTYVFGDGSGNNIKYNIRDGKNTFESSKWHVLDWIGWKLMEWDLTQGECYAWVTGDGILDPPGNQFYFDSYQMSAAAASPGGIIYLDNFQAVILGAKTPVNLDDPDAGKGIDVHTADNLIKISAETNINELKVYSLSGLLVKSAEPNQTIYGLETNDLPKGIYIVKVTTETAQKNVKVVVK